MGMMSLEDSCIQSNTFDCKDFLLKNQRESCTLIIFKSKINHYKEFQASKGLQVSIACGAIREFFFFFFFF